MVPFVDQYQNSLKCKYAYICKKKKRVEGYTLKF